METTATSIMQYLDLQPDSVDYLCRVVCSVSAETLCNTLNGLLRSEDYETVSSASHFVRDLVLFGSRHSGCKQFVQRYPESSIVSTLEQNLFSPNHFIRKNAIYTLGKTGSYSSVTALNRAFSTLRDTDPILLPRLIGEVGWLGGENLWSLLDSMMSSAAYTTRWAVLPVLNEFSGDDARTQDKLFKRKLNCVEQLRQDEKDLIRTEAEYEYQVLKFRSESYTLLRTERKKLRKALERQYKPEFWFRNMSSMFANYMYKTGTMQYSVGEFEAFISNIAQAPPIT